MLFKRLIILSEQSLFSVSNQWIDESVGLNQLYCFLARVCVLVLILVIASSKLISPWI